MFSNEFTILSNGKNEQNIFSILFQHKLSCFNGKIDETGLFHDVL